jgi:hypothetical protein
MKKLFYIEVTDTFGGEANYTWVTRHIIKAKSKLGAIQRFSKVSGLNWRHDYQNRYNSKSGETCLFISEYDPEYNGHFTKYQTDERGE